MMKLSKLATIATIAACAGSLCWQSPRASAQDEGPPPPAPPEAPAPAAATPAAKAPGETAPGGPGGPGGGGDRMEQFRQRMNDRIKTALAANDEEWGVIQPLLNKVQDKMRETMLGRFGGGMRPPRPNGGNGGNGDENNRPSPERAERQNRPDRPPQAGSAESQALQTALENSSTSNTEIKAKLEALRESRKKALADLEKARAELKAVLSLHQEATLVVMGMLD